MYYLLHLKPSQEGGPDVEFVCGVFETKAKAQEAKQQFKEINKDDLDQPGDLDDERFSVQECDGLYFVQTCYDFHGEQQNEIVDTFNKESDADIYLSHADGNCYKQVYELDKVMSL